MITKTELTPEQIKVLDEVRLQFEKETGNKWMTVPVTHGELAFASWKYQLWLENKAASQFPPLAEQGHGVYRKVLVSHRNPVFEEKGLSIFHTNLGKLFFNNIDNEWVSKDPWQDVKYPEFWLERTQSATLHLQKEFNKLSDIRALLLMHPNGEMIERSCLHFLGDAAQAWWQNKNSSYTKDQVLQIANDAWDAGNKYGSDQQNVMTPEGQIYPDKEAYLKSLDVVSDTVQEEEGLTVGEIISEAIRLHELNPVNIEKQLGFPINSITGIMNNECYTNTIPVVLFKNLLISLHISFEKIEPAILRTFELIKSKETSESINKNPAGHLLWENKESLTKYINKLKDLMKSPII